MDYVLIYSDTKDTIEDILEKIYADFVENNLKDLLTSKWLLISKLKIQKITRSHCILDYQKKI